MNITAVKQAVKEAIVTAEATIISGLTHQGMSRSFAHVTTTALTPPQGYYYIVVDSSGSESRSKVAGNASMPARVNLYSMNISIADYAVGQTGEDELYEKMAGDFATVVSRLVGLFETTAMFTDPDSGNTFRLIRALAGGSDRSIRVNNIPNSWSDADGFHALLLSQISFQLEGC